MAVKPELACPLCRTLWHSQGRYPRAICHDCSKEIRDENGNTVSYGNYALGGGLELEADGRVYRDSDAEKVPLFIGSTRVRLEEARFGGVVVLPVLTSDSELT